MNSRPGTENSQVGLYSSVMQGLNGRKPSSAGLSVATWLYNSVVTPRVKLPTTSRPRPSRQKNMQNNSSHTYSLRREPSALECSFQDWLPPVRKEGQGKSTYKWRNLLTLPGPGDQILHQQ